MAIYYIDIDDEITSAAARIRDSSDSRIGLVIQGGSRLATSRINFKLLAREARRHGRRLSIIAADASVRSLAQTADLPVFASVAEYQKSEPQPTASFGSTPAAGMGPVWDAFGELASTVDTPGGRAGQAGPRRAIGPGQPAPRPAARFSPRAYRWLAIGIVAALVIGGLGAIVLLPSATVVLTVRGETVGPLDFTVKVDPTVSTTNDTALTVPGVAREFAAQANGTFAATGQNVVDTAATGTVTFISCNTGGPVPVPSGTQIETAGKVAFATTAAVTVPKATLVGLTCKPSTADVAVTAVKKGPSGNVAAGAIVNVPPSLAAALVVQDQVTNKKATSGGTHTVTPFVQQADLDAAEASLASQVDSSVQAKMTEPSAVPSGLELFPSTAHMDGPTFDPDPATLLNQPVASFDLAATGQATATAANLDAVRSLAERRIKAQVQAGHSLVDGSISVTLGSPTADGSAVSVPVVAGAVQAATVDVGELRDGIKGKTVEEAKAYLSAFGDAEVSTSPFWVSTITGFDFRIDVEVVAPTGQSAPTPRITLAPVRTAGHTPATAPSGSETASPAASPTVPPTPGPTPTPASSASTSPVPTPTPPPTTPTEPSPSASP